ncbi:MAG: hypothetical protein LBP34_03865 [Flavobacteriaceae bacterium]|jgi:hypothetical protein|nr:hypothetical protein [Flavobacteriaceae bacterium]
MKNFLYIFITMFLFSGCSAYKTASEELDRGNYARAFETSIKVFQKNSSRKKRDKQLVLLQNSYLKANEKDEKNLTILRSQSNPNYKEIYYRVKSLYDRVNAIRPLLPLYNGGRELKFPTKDYSAELAVAKENYLDQYYMAALDMLKTQDKDKARQAYQYLTEVKNVDKLYRDVNNMQNIAYDQGVDIVYVAFLNQTGVPFQDGFRNNLLSSLNSSVNDFWTMITINSSEPHDYEVDVILRQAFVGNDIVTSNTYNYEKRIPEGWEYLKDKRGNIVKDSLGNPIKTDRYITVRAQVREFVRHKEAMLSADIQIHNSYTSLMMDSYPVTTNFAFNASYATMTGDRRALGRDILNLVNTTPAPFPRNYDMLFQCGIELRERLIKILKTFN